ncbi:MAG: secondary thiamine-phosphate synthase enzyme YjbQ [Spirochaetes bacterium]|nr:secondary thiamine-phosphate synthase enzyme YjbQ [Spirochaetota bacterium]
MFEVLSVRTGRKNEIVGITSLVQNIVSKSKIKSGVCVIFNPHTTAAITINEDADPSVKSDILNELERMVPESGQYSHSEGNSDAHIKASLMGSDRIVIINEGKLALGTWQGIFFCEFDGPRSRKVYIKVIPD